MDTLADQPWAGSAPGPRVSPCVGRTLARDARELTFQRTPSSFSSRCTHPNRPAWFADYRHPGLASHRWLENFNTPPGRRAAYEDLVLQDCWTGHRPRIRARSPRLSVADISHPSISSSSLRLYPSSLLLFYASSPSSSSIFSFSRVSKPVFPAVSCFHPGPSVQAPCFTTTTCCLHPRTPHLGRHCGKGVRAITRPGDLSCLDYELDCIIHLRFSASRSGHPVRNGGPA